MLLDEKSGLQGLEELINEMRQTPSDALLHETGYKHLQELAQNHPALFSEYSCPVYTLLDILFMGDVVPPRLVSYWTAEQLLRKYQLTPDSHFDPDDTLLTALATDRLFIATLEKTINNHAELELVLTQLRAHILVTYHQKMTGWHHLIPLLSALSHQCFNNEYIFHSQKQEEEIVNQLYDRLNTSCRHNQLYSNEVNLLIVAMYRPIYPIFLDYDLTKMSIHEYSAEFQSILNRLVYQPLKETYIIKSIPSIGQITDATSQSVRQQYEENPYPRWIRLYGPFNPLENQIRKKHPDFVWPESAHADQCQILVPGCGTGEHPLKLAMSNPGAQIWAIDLSQTSLAYGKRMAETLGIHNVTFLHGDLMAISELACQFHHIDCIGVLHHLEQPLEGWRVLNQVLLPGGTFHVGLYSRVARLPITFVRDEIAALHIPSTPDAMRAFRHQLITKLTFRPFLKRFVRNGAKPCIYPRREAQQPQNALL